MTDESPAVSWRAVLAALANDDARLLYARLVAGDAPHDAASGLPQKKLDRVLETLARAGLLARDTEGRVNALAPFAGILATMPVERADGVERFLRDGKLVGYPAKASERRELLVFVAERAFDDDEDLTEPQVNERLRVFTRDHATLRRYLVDLGILERTRSGTSYALSPRRQTAGA